MARILDRVFGIDVRSLAAFRIGLGSVLLVDLAFRATDLEAHYGDQGVFPLELMQRSIKGSWKWSLHAWNGSVPFQALLFSVAALAALALLVGYRSRVACVASWVLLLSLQTRNPLVNNGGDILLKCMLFWSMFLPLDRCWAVRRSRTLAASRQVELSIATAALLLQVALMYFLSGCYKLDGGWHSADILQRILRSDCYARPLAYAIVDYSTMLTLMGWASLWGELLLPWLVFSPCFTKQIRMLAIVWFWMFHLGIQLTLTVGLFSVICWIAWIPFMPSEVWDNWLSGKLPDEQPAATSEKQTAGLSFRWLQTVSDAAVALLLLTVVTWNLSHLSATRDLIRWPAELQGVIELTGLQQKWNMFQSPMRNDGWHVVAAKLEDEQVVDLLRGGAPADWDSYEKPEYIYRRFPNHRWRKYYRNLTRERWVKCRSALCDYLARRWTIEHPDEPTIQSIEMHYMQEIGDGVQESDRFQQQFLCNWWADSK